MLTYSITVVVNSNTMKDGELSLAVKSQLDTPVSLIGVFELSSHLSLLLTQAAC